MRYRRAQAHLPPATSGLQQSSNGLRFPCSHHRSMVQGYWTYTVPGINSGPEWSRRWLTGGWQTSGTVNFHGATALTATATGSCNRSSTTGNTYALTLFGTWSWRRCHTSQPLWTTAPLSKRKLRRHIGLRRCRYLHEQDYKRLHSVVQPILGYLPGGVLHRRRQIRCRLLSATFKLLRQYQAGPDSRSARFWSGRPISHQRLPRYRRRESGVSGRDVLTFNRANYKAPTLAAGDAVSDKHYGGMNVNSTSTGQVTSTIGGTSGSQVSPRVNPSTSSSPSRSSFNEGPPTHWDHYRIGRWSRPHVS